MITQCNCACHSGLARINDGIGLSNDNIKSNPDINLLYENVTLQGMIIAKMAAEIESLKKVRLDLFNNHAEIINSNVDRIEKVETRIHIWNVSIRQIRDEMHELNRCLSEAINNFIEQKV